jgi:hypothetical protein
MVSQRKFSWPQQPRTTPGRTRSAGWAERRIPGLRTLLHGLDDATRERVLALTAGRRHCAPGEPLYQAGSPVSTLYAVQAGALKSLAGAERHRRVVGYHVVGDLLGFAGLASGTHAGGGACDASDGAIALRRDREVERDAELQLQPFALRLRTATWRRSPSTWRQRGLRPARAFLPVGERWGAARVRRRFALHLDNAEVGACSRWRPTSSTEAGLPGPLVEHGQTVALPTCPRSGGGGAGALVRLTRPATKPLMRRRRRRSAAVFAHAVAGRGRRSCGGAQAGPSARRSVSRSGRSSRRDRRRRRP